LKGTLTPTSREDAATKFFENRTPGHNFIAGMISKQNWTLDDISTLGIPETWKLLGFRQRWFREPVAGKAVTALRELAKLIADPPETNNS
jgi:hypothetical protein